MATWLSPDVAIALMLLGVAPSLVAVNLLYGDRRKPGVLWFLVSMATGGLWALLFATMTAVRSPELTLALANFFWPVVVVAAVSMFLLAYEFVFKQIASRPIVAVLFAPVAMLFVLTWLNPSELVFTADYYVDADGFLHFPLFGGPLRLLIVQVYGYGLVVLAAGMFVGESMRTTGIQRRQAVYLLVVFSALVGSTVIKVAGLVPAYYDPTSTVYAFSGLLFAYSINRHGLLKFVPVAREQTFEEVNDTIIVVDAEDTIVDVNRSGRELFGTQIMGESIHEVVPDADVRSEGDTTESIQLDIEGTPRYFSLRVSSIQYGRGSVGSIFVLSDVSALKERENELNLLKEIFSRVFRHNIRNDLTVINGYTDLIMEQADEEILELAEGITERSNHLQNQAEKVREIEQIITENRTVTGSLAETVDQAITASRPISNAVLRTSVEDTLVEYHPRFHLAIQELIENAIAHHAAPGKAAIKIYPESDENTVTLVVEDDGPGIPQGEIDVLRAERETTLEHGSGIGLWLVRWLVTHSNGELMAEAMESGTRVRIHLSKVDTEVHNSE